MGRESLKELSKLLSNWDFCFIDAIGRSGGNVTDGINAPSPSLILGPFLQD
jgi:hypothetical protein